MRGVTTFVLMVVCGLLLTAAVAVPAPATTAGACSVTQAERDVREAKRAYVRAAGRLSEARNVLSATRTYNAMYGTGVGRWVRCARRSGWSWTQFPVLMRVIDGESRGNPSAVNPTSGAAGLLQHLPSWYQGRWWQHTYDPFVPVLNLRYGRLIWRLSGWSAWSAY